MTSNIKDTGKNQKTDWVHIFTVRGGLISNFLEFFNSAVVANAFQKAASA